MFFPRRARAGADRQDGEPRDGGSDSSGESHAGRVLGHRSERGSRPAADRSGGRTERRQKLRARELRGKVRHLFMTFVYFLQYLHRYFTNIRLHRHKKSNIGL